MALDADEEILQDFLVESGEILEQLSEQLVQLENNPHDMDLLNAIFRGFHTVKGGAGFMQLDALVDCCHKAENVFDTLRNGERTVDSNLMDVVLKALDVVNTQFDEVRSREAPTPADPQLLEQLARLAKPESEDTGGTGSAQPTGGQQAGQQAEGQEGDITDAEFEQLLDAINPGDQEASGDAPAGESRGAGDPGSSDDDDEISEDEFEALLDQLHGEGKHAGAPPDPEAVSSTGGGGAEAGGESGAVDSARSSGDDDEISEDEFESLLDELHGPGQFKPDTAETAGQGGASGSEPEAPASAAPERANAAPSADNRQPANAGSAEPAAPPDEPARSAGGGAGGGQKGGDQKPASGGGGGGGKDQAAVAAESTVRVDTRRLDDIMNMVGELVLIRNRLKRLSDELEDGRVQKTVSNLDVVTGDLQSSVMQTRMQPIKKVFGRFPRVVRDLARSLEKEVNLSMSGEDTDLDKNLVEALSDPLVHLVRNAVDHGVEMPDERERNGKPRVGRVALSAEQEGDHIQLVIEDDGGGMDPEALRRKAVEKGVYEQEAADRLTENECYQLIFAPGFSTKTEISDVSGRGVGMDVVKTKINQLNGSIDIDSELGRGSRIVIKVPLTLAIMPTLMVKLEDQPFALPLVNVVEIFHLDLSKKNIVDGRECIVVRDHVYPLFYIKKWLVEGASVEADDTDAHVVVVAVGTKRVGFVVDQLIGQEEVVIKPLGKMLQGTAGMAGATITGDGTIALILDVPSLLQHYA
ncbi:chemotaxis protein CheA [Halovibrio salipaludis]|uniref:Chemotaxis protein CheA n=1 Tax=Halovibrio salipaludis TaxID=2032626 RepID=A0A2A2FA25_9GAMM|nr:chemotaxis protein CheA [Halovibrio salipaludis]PAU81393.1 chemotaxis protein CheA [Halovibrio salipaludis]